MISRVLCGVAMAIAWLTIAGNGLQTETADLVTVHAAAGAADLTKDDFEVAVDGRPVPIVSFAPPPANLSVVLLLDKSASMEEYSDIDDEIGRSFAPALKPGDRARVGGLANRLVLAPAFAARANDVTSAGRAAVSFRKQDRFGPSPLWDAMDRVLAALEPEQGLRAIIVVTDGRATGNVIGIADVTNRALDAGVVIDVLSESRPMIIRQSETTAARIRPNLPLTQLARTTGGSIVPEDPNPTTPLPEPGPVIKKFVDDLHARYTLGIAPSGPPGSVHRLEVRVKRAGLTARTRSAYRTR